MRDSNHFSHHFQRFITPRNAMNFVQVQRSPTVVGIPIKRWFLYNSSTHDCINTPLPPRAGDRTPLHIATLAKKFDVANVLLNYGASRSLSLYLECCGREGAAALADGYKVLWPSPAMLEFAVSKEFLLLEEEGAAGASSDRKQNPKGSGRGINRSLSFDQYGDDPVNAPLDEKDLRLALVGADLYDRRLVCRSLLTALLEQEQESSESVIAPQRGGVVSVENLVFAEKDADLDKFGRILEDAALLMSPLMWICHSGHLELLYGHLDNLIDFSLDGSAITREPSTVRFKVRGVEFLYSRCPILPITYPHPPTRPSMTHQDDPHPPTRPNMTRILRRAGNVTRILPPDPI